MARAKRRIQKHATKNLVEHYNQLDWLSKVKKAEK